MDVGQLERAMERKCLKCGEVAAAGAAADASCPKCGAIYSKVAAAQMGRGAGLPSPVRRVAVDSAPGKPWLERVLWALAFLGGGLGLVTIIGTHLSAESAAQQAAGMAMAVAYCVVPYVMARAAQAWRRED